MRRYFVEPITKGRLSSLDQDSPYLPNLTVYAKEQVARETGLLDKDGRKIMASDPAPPIGFLAHTASGDS